ncbi:hypothetical protein A3Q32_19780 [Alcanivorax sp. KX64203]|nr:hypothetical protein A3Q32_19780 [Alcanivorax sp. KX64203]
MGASLAGGQAFQRWAIRLQASSHSGFVAYPWELALLANQAFQRWAIRLQGKLVWLPGKS